MKFPDLESRKIYFDILTVISEMGISMFKVGIQSCGGITTEAI